MNFNNIFILQILFQGHFRGAIAGIFFKMLKVIYFRANILSTFPR